MFITIVEDTVYEDNEEFFGQLVTNDSVVTITEPTATVHVADNDGEFYYTYVQRT